MSQDDAQRALDLYKGFVAQTQAVNAFLANAKQFQFALTVAVPTFQVVRLSPSLRLSFAAAAAAAPA